MSEPVENSPPSEAEIADMQMETAFCFDIIVRVLSGRRLPVCIDAMLKNINAVAEQLPPNAREWLTCEVEKFSTHLRATMPTEIHPAPVGTTIN